MGISSTFKRHCASGPFKRSVWIGTRNLVNTDNHAACLLFASVDHSVSDVSLNTGMSRDGRRQPCPCPASTRATRCVQWYGWRRLVQINVIAVTAFFCNLHMKVADGSLASCTSLHLCDSVVAASVILPVFNSTVCPVVSPASHCAPILLSTLSGRSLRGMLQTASPTQSHVGHRCG